MTCANKDFILTAECWKCKKKIWGKDWASAPFRVRLIDGKNRVLCLECEAKRE